MSLHIHGSWGYGVTIFFLFELIIKLTFKDEGEQTKDAKEH